VISHPTKTCLKEKVKFAEGDDNTVSEEEYGNRISKKSSHNDLRSGKSGSKWTIEEK
jgi:hypothetical protein